MCNEQSPPRTIVPQDEREVVIPIKETTLRSMQAKKMVLQKGMKEMNLVKECKDACSREGSKEKKVALSKEKRSTMTEDSLTEIPGKLEISIDNLTSINSATLVFHEKSHKMKERS